MTTYREPDVAAYRSRRTRRRVAHARRAVGPGVVLGAVAGVLVLLSCFLSWREPSAEAADIPLAFLWDDGTTAQHPSLLLVLIPLGAMLLVGAAVRMGSIVRLVGGVGTLVVAGLFAFQLDRVLDRTPTGDLWDAVDIGFSLAVVGGVLGVFAGLVPGARRRRGSAGDDI